MDRSLPSRSCASVVREKYNVRKCASCTDNDDYEYPHNKCPHAGNLRSQVMVISPAEMSSIRYFLYALRTDCLVEVSGEKKRVR
jgi:hypothetical protein